MAKGKYEYWLTNDGLTLIEGWVREGLSDEQLAHNMGINRTTLYDWQKKYPDIANTMKKTKEVVDFYVENALIQEALRGNVTAQIFWLKNRKPKQWRDKPIEITTEDVKQHKALIDAISKMGDDE